MPRHLAIGDIHGCSNAFQALCDFVQLRQDDIIITLGDYCNRGPNSHAVLDLLIQLTKSCNLKPLRGNHEIIMLDARKSTDDLKYWLDVGGDATLRSYALFEGDSGRIEDIPERHWRFLEEELLPFYEMETHFFVHANAYTDVDLEDQPEYILYWERYSDPPRHQSGKIMVCGHTSQKSGVPITNGNAICIDTFAYGGGWLTCLEAESHRVWQANQEGQTRAFWLDDIA